MVQGKETIETSLGKVWITRFDNGDVSIWTPPGSRQANAVAEIIDGRAAWKPKYRAWFVPPIHAEPLLADIEDL